MRILFFLMGWIYYVSVSAQAILIGFDYIPHTFIAENWGYESSINLFAYNTPSSEYEMHLGYRFGDDEKSVLSLAYGRGGYGDPTMPYYIRKGAAPDWNLLFEYHLFRITYGTWMSTRNGRNALIPTFGILLAPTQYEFKKSLVDYFGNTFTERHKKDRLNIGIQGGVHYLFKLAGPIFIKTGFLMVITPQFMGPFANDPYKGYNPGPSMVPGGGTFPLFNILFTLGLTIELDQTLYSK